MKNIITLIVVVVVLGVVGFFFLGNEESVQSEQLSPQALDGSDGSAGSTLLEEDVTPDESVVSGVNDSQEPSSEGAKTVTVSYTDSGFSPKEITINKGDTVRFENENGPSMWVGSANHPTHTLYPEKTSLDCLGSAFDQCEGVVAGNSWSFTFTEVGEWGYHNHLRAGHWGRVIVK